MRVVRPAAQVATTVDASSPCSRARSFDPPLTSTRATLAPTGSSGRKRSVNAGPGFVTSSSTTVGDVFHDGSVSRRVVHHNGRVLVHEEFRGE